MNSHRSVIGTFVLLLLAGLLLSCSDTIQEPNPLQMSRLDKTATQVLSMDETGAVPLIAGKNITMGTVTVSNDRENLYVELQTNRDWFIAETHLQVGESLDDFPLAGRWGNPVPGRFDYKETHDPAVSEYKYTLPLSERQPGDVLLIAVHASVEKWVDEELIQQEGAWAAGERFTQRGNWGMYFSYTIEEAGLVLWNTLSSVEAVENSEVGPNGTIVGTVHFENEVMFGKGITPKIGSARSGVDFPTTVVDPERGSVELWAKFYDKPVAYSHGAYGFVNVCHWRFEGLTANVMMFAWHNNNSKLIFRLRFNAKRKEITTVSVPGFDPDLDTPVHLACAWDREGIDGSGDYMRIYVNGTLVGANNTENCWGIDNTSGAFRVAAPWDWNYGADRYSVENIRVWNYAKTDFDT